eukprot:CAMPEP_0115013084 /NCGR_PEP_ID=MMETSP0216-20121206/25170_1 /TAXON_ID=223996 /ORGANISM="Protocruzia adherens, Strain Boccale" /LENGTH=299 /DNA_ID=CAMNT_0002382361 /DNA_START=163 /DNA_END=1062 /DNA_ORIENTATION=+
MVTFFMIGFAFDTVEPNHVALRYDSLSKAYEDDKVYKPGRYHVGITGAFREYSTTWKDITFSNDLDGDSGTIESKTKNPATIWLEISFQYRLRWEELYLLYEKFPNDNYEDNFMLKAKAAIQKVPEDYLIDDFIQKREEISFQMAKKVQQTLDGAYVEITSFQMLNVYFDNKFELTFTDGQVKNRQTETETLRQQINEMQGQVNVIESNAQKLIDQKLAEKQTEGEVAYQTHFQLARKELLQAEGTGYQTYTNVEKGLKFTTEQLLQYIWIRKIRDDSSTEKTEALAGFDLNSILKLTT